MPILCARMPNNINKVPPFFFFFCLLMCLFWDPVYKVNVVVEGMLSHRLSDVVAISMANASTNLFKIISQLRIHIVL